MRPANGLKVIESCLACPVRHDGFLCDLSPKIQEALDAITFRATYPKGALLLAEGEPPRGVFLLCSGRVKLSASSADGKTMILRVTEPGEVVGMPAAISGKPYDVTAEVLEPVQASFIPRDLFLRFLAEHGEAALRIAQLLSNIYHHTCREVRALGLSRSSSQKLAKFLLDWSGRPGLRYTDGRVALTLTHEEIAQTINTSRETVSRLLAQLRRDQVIQTRGTSLLIRNRKALQLLAG